MGKDSSSRSFDEYHKEAPLAADTSAKLILTGEVRRSPLGGKFVFSSPDVGTVELEVEAGVDFEPVDGGLTRITLDASYARDLSALASASDSEAERPELRVRSRRR